MNMRINKHIPLIAAAALLLLGCIKEPDAGSIVVEASIGAPTKVAYDGAKSSFAAGDKIAVYAWTGSASEVPVTRVVDGVVNTFDGSAWTPASLMRWRNGSDAHYFLGVSPVHAISSFTADEYILDPADYAANDLLFAANLGGVKSGDGAVKLGFRHAMAKLAVNLSFRDQFGGTPEVSAVTLSAKTKASVNYLTQTVSATGDAASVSLPAATANSCYSAILVPQDGIRKITVTIAGKDYVYAAGEDIPLASGQVTTLNLTVGKDKLEFSGVTIKDWETEVLADAEPEPDMLRTPLTLESVYANAPVNVTFSSTLSTARELQYSLDGGESWKTMTIAAGKPAYTDKESNYHKEAADTLVLTGVSRVLLKAANESYGEYSSVGLDTSTEYERRLQISVDADCYIYGNMMSLVGGDQFATRTDLKEDRTFWGMFMNNTKLKNHPAKKLLLPATTLTAMCYRYMFWNCKALTVAPDLPAKEMKEKCYSGMFTGCSALTATPALPATTLAKSCYYGMFSNCSSLTSASELPAPTLAPYCYQEMFRNCTSLTKAPELLATEAAAYSCQSMFWGCSALKTAPSKLAATVAEHCYDSMFDLCTFLESAPELPAMTMAPYCYAAMFRRCPSLETAPALPAITLADHCYDSMFFNQSGVPGYKLKNAPALPATTLADNCYTYMFSGCKSLTKAPDLPAKELANGCYVCMFNNCTSLNYVKCLATSIASDATVSPTYNWLHNVPGSGSFVKDASVNYASGQFWDTSTEYGTTTKCAARVFSDGGWTVRDAE